MILLKVSTVIHQKYTYGHHICKAKHSLPINYGDTGIEFGTCAKGHRLVLINPQSSYLFHAQVTQELMREH